MRKPLIFLLLASLFPGNWLYAQSLNGVYLAEEEGVESLWEIYERGDDAEIISITDIFGVGFTGNRTGNQIVLDGGGTASVAGNGNLNIQALGRNIFLRRVATTDSSFPLRRDGTYQTPEYFGGPWDIEEISIDLITGETLPQFDGSLVFIDVFTLSHEGDDALRFNDSLNTYFQGVPLNGQDFIFRIIRNPFVSVEPGFETIPGSANNFFRDVLGQGHFTDINHFEVDLVLQTFEVIPSHFLLNILGTRRNSVAEGDVDLDGTVNTQDRTAIHDLLGHDKRSQGYRLSGDLDGNGLIDFADLDQFDGESTPEKMAGPWMTGNWFDPARAGEGFHIFVLDNERAIVTWFSYGPNGGQAWFIGVGRIEGHSIVVDETEITSGTRFGSGFDPDDVVRENWGSIRISFEGCSNATVTFLSSKEGYGNGGYRLQRLTTPQGVNCPDMATFGSNTGRFTSAWFDASRSGEGWFFEELPDGRVVVTWYTYDLDGGQMWLLGVGTIENGIVEVPELLIVQGGIFGDDFDPGLITETVWGSLRFEKTDCPSGDITYDALDPAFGSATRSVVLLAGVSGLDCSDP